MKRLFGVAVVAVLSVAAFAPGAPAAEPASGSLDSENPSVTWTGRPEVPTDGALEVGCPTGEEPWCDTFSLAIGRLAKGANDVIISATPDSEFDLIDIHVYDDAGNLVAEEKGGGTAATVILDGPASGTYDVRVSAVLAAGVDPLAPSVEPRGSYRGAATATNYNGFRFEADPEQDCVQPAPTAVDPLAVVGDDGSNVDLDVLVYLDGVTEERAARIFEIAAQSYAPLGVTLKGTFRSADAGTFVGNNAIDLMNQLKAKVKGVPPKGFDIVELLTSKDIHALGQAAVAGLADCIGGVRYDDRAFLVAEAEFAGIDDEIGLQAGPITFYKFAGAKTTAHEIGHLMGGHHHYANCVEGLDPATEVAEPSPCTLMFNSLDFMSLNFGTLNAQVVRAHAVQYAQP